MTIKQKLVRAGGVAVTTLMCACAQMPGKPGAPIESRSASPTTTQTVVSDHPECNDTGCNIVAQTVPWPKALSGPSLNLQVEPWVLLNLPSNPVRVIQNGDVLLVSYKSGALYAFHSVTGDGDDAGKNGHYTQADRARIIFTKTAADRKPDNNADLKLWRDALSAKQNYLMHVKRVYTSHRGAMSAYYFARGKDPLFGGGEAMAVIINDDAPYGYLEVSARHVDFMQFKKVVGTFHNRKEGEAIVVQARGTKTRKTAKAARKAAVKNSSKKPELALNAH